MHNLQFHAFNFEDPKLNISSNESFLLIISKLSLFSLIISFLIGISFTYSSQNNASTGSIYSSVSFLQINSSFITVFKRPAFPFYIFNGIIRFVGINFFTSQICLTGTW